MSSGRILIAGATGTTGTALISQLSSMATPIRALVRNPRRAANLASETVEIVQGDLGKPETLLTALTGIEKAYIATAIAPDAVSLFSNFFASAARAGVTHIVKLSGLGADIRSSSELLRQHGESDEILRESGLKYTILRANSFFQNILLQARQIRARARFALPMGTARQSLVDVRDLAEVTVNALNRGAHDNQTYDLTGPESLSYHEVADHLSTAVGGTITYIPTNAEAAMNAMCAAGLPKWTAHALAEIQELFATGVFAEATDELGTLLGREPRRFQDFAADHMQCFR